MRALAFLLLMLAPALAQMSLENTGAANAGGALAFEEGAQNLIFRLIPYPPKQFPAYYTPNLYPFLLTVAIPSPGSWRLSVSLIGPLFAQGDLSAIPPSQLEVAVAPEGQPQGPWLGLQAAPLVAVIRQPGIYRYWVWLRLKMTGREAPGLYQGTLFWSLAPGL
jgi:hypothetical protein